MKTTTRPLQHSISRSAPQLALLLIPLALASFALLPQARAVDPPPDGGDWTWKEAGRLNTARYLHTATLLPNGMVLVAGGAGRNVNALASAELYDPASRDLDYHRQPQHRTFIFTRRHCYKTAWSLLSEELTPIPVLPRARNCTTRRAGPGLPRAASTPHAFITPRRCYTMAWSLFQGDMITSNFKPQAPNCTTRQAGPGVPHAASTPHAVITRLTLLPNDRVLVSGGIDSNFNPSASVELYSPASGTWTTTSFLRIARYSHTATSLQNGIVLVSGGLDTNGRPVARAERGRPQP